MEISILKISDFCDNQMKKLSEFISEDKRCRLNKYRKQEDRIRGLYGELLIRKMIIEKFKIKNNDIFFRTNKYGKPFLIGRDDIYFNVSHSGEYVVSCLDNKPIGIDVEMIKTIEFEDIIEKFFTIKERDYILGENSSFTLDEKIARFYEVWTYKESFLKCIGKGLSIPLNSFSMCFDKENKIRVHTKESDNRFLFKEIKLNKRYKMSICSEGNDITNKINYITQEELINSFIFYDRNGC